jgi:hypothetical protein
VAPPTDIVESFPKYLTRKGASKRAISSRMMFDSNAIVPSSAPLYSVMKILDNE